MPDAARLIVFLPAFSLSGYLPGLAFMPPRATMRMTHSVRLARMPTAALWRDANTLCDAAPRAPPSPYSFVTFAPRERALFISSRAGCRTISTTRMPLIGISLMATAVPMTCYRPSHAEHDCLFHGDAQSLVWAAGCRRVPIIALTWFFGYSVIHCIQRDRVTTRDMTTLTLFRGLS